MIVATHGTSLPLETNRVDLDPELRDAWGLPAMRVTYKDHPDDLAMARFLQDRGVEVMQAGGAQQVWKGPSPDARHPEPVRLRRVELRHLRARPANDDHPGAGGPRRRAHRRDRATRRDLNERLRSIRTLTIGTERLPSSPGDQPRHQVVLLVALDDEVRRIEERDDEVPEQVLLAGRPVDELKVVGRARRQRGDLVAA